MVDINTSCLQVLLLLLMLGEWPNDGVVVGSWVDSMNGQAVLNFKDCLVRYSAGVVIVVHELAWETSCSESLYLYLCMCCTEGWLSWLWRAGLRDSVGWRGWPVISSRRGLMYQNEGKECVDSKGRVMKERRTDM